MLANCLAGALRHFAREPLYFLVHVIGLAVAITAALLIGLFVYDELHYERFMPGATNAYIVYTVVTPPEGHAPIEALTSEPDIASWLRLDIPEVAQVARIGPSERVVRHGNFTARQTVFWADPEILSILRLPVYAGHPEGALRHPDAAILTKTAARRFFGRDDPVGETLELAEGTQMTVVAVLEDLPSSTHLYFDIMASGNSQASAFADVDRMPVSSSLGFGGKAWTAYTYLTLKPGAAPLDVERQLPALLDRHAPSGQGLSTSSIYHLHLQPIPEIHLHEDMRGAMKPSGHRQTVYALAAIAVLILLVAAVNFVNLVTARASQRVIEVGVRKAAGAGRGALIAQFLGETLIYVILAGVVAVLLAYLTLPVVNAFLHRTIEFAYGSKPTLALQAVALLVILAAAVGIYPALVLSGLHPVRVFGAVGTASSPQGAAVRRNLVVAQLAMLIGLSLAAIVIYRQALFAVNESLRLDTDAVMVIRDGCSGGLKDAVKALSGVVSAACSDWVPPDNVPAAAGASLPQGQSVVLSYTSIDYGFLELYGLKPVAGRFPDVNHGTDELTEEAGVVQHEGVVLNEAAIRAFGFRSAAAAIGSTFTWSHWVPRLGVLTSRHQAQIIGVAPDFLTGSIHEFIEPAAFYVHRPSNRALSVRLNGHSIPETLSSIDELWKQMNGGSPINRSFVDQLLRGKYEDLLRQASLLTIFSAVAVLVACLGLYTLAAHRAERRRKEIGVRKALGASRLDITRLLLWEFARPILWANLIAWVLGFLAMHRWLQGFAYHTELRLWMFVLAGGLATAVTLLTVFAHTAAIARLQPVNALRYE